MPSSRGCREIRPWVFEPPCASPPANTKGGLLRSRISGQRRRAPTDNTFPQAMDKSDLCRGATRVEAVSCRYTDVFAQEPFAP